MRHGFRFELGVERDVIFILYLERIRFVFGNFHHLISLEEILLFSLEFTWGADSDIYIFFFPKDICLGHFKLC